jgi:hypothetical protein
MGPRIRSNGAITQLRNAALEVHDAAIESTDFPEKKSEKKQ